MSLLPAWSLSAPRSPVRCGALGIIVLVRVAGTTILGAGDAPLADAVLRAPLLAADEPRRELETLLRSRLPPLEAPGSAEAWQAQVAELRRRVLESVVFRGWPAELVARRATSRFVERRDIETGNGYRIRKLLYEPVPGLSIPALLYEPDPGPEGAAGRAPVVLHLNGHVRAPGKAVDYKQILSANLARRGFLVLSPEWFACGELSGPGYRHDAIAWIDLAGRSGLALFYLALRGGLDVLLEHPRADAMRVAVTGLSGGGWQTILIAALDERVTTCAPNAGYMGIGERLEHEGSIGDLEQVPQDLLLAADYTHLTAMLLPRPALLIYNRADDCCFPASLARRSIHDPVAPFYARFAPWAELTFHDSAWPGDHNYGLDNRQAFYRFINRQWLPPPRRLDDELGGAADVLPAEDLMVGVPPDNVTFLSLARDLTRDLPRVRAAELIASPDRRVEVRAALRSVLRWRAAAVKRAEAQAIEGARGFKLHTDGGATVPVVDLGPPRGPVTLIVDDGGRASTAEAAGEALRGGRRVLIPDLMLLGERRPRALSIWAATMLLSSAGIRAVAEEAAELLAIARWARVELDAAEVRLVARGRVAALAALVAAALDGGEGERLLDRVATSGAPTSLKDLLGQELWPDALQLLPFGLLEVADIDGLRALARPGVVEP